MRPDTKLKDAASLRKSLDCAIAGVAKAEYSRLKRRLGINEQRERVEKALKSLKELQQGGRAEYGDKWTAVFYLTWYQPRQIQLAYAALRALLRRAPRPPKYIIDYGCGAWAILIALALLMGEESQSSESGGKVIAVHGIDPNQPMRQIGRRLWKKFQGVVPGGPLRDVLDKMGRSCSCHASYDNFAKSHAAPVKGDCWLTAVHVVDRLNQDDLHAMFERVRRERVPAIELLTTDSSKQDQVRFFKGEVFDVRQTAWQDEELEMTTRWRRELGKRLGVHGDGNLTGPYLDNSVKWDPWSKLAQGKDVVMIRRRAAR